VRKRLSVVTDVQRKEGWNEVDVSVRFRLVS
jgi:hypothetical protein